MSQHENLIGFVLLTGVAVGFLAVFLWATLSAARSTTPSATAAAPSPRLPKTASLTFISV